MALTFKPLTLEDVPFVHELYNEPSVHHQAVLQELSVTTEGIEGLIRHWLSEGRFLHFIILDESGIPLGLSQMFAIDRIEGTCELGLLLMPHAQSQGIGVQAHEHQIYVARDILGLRAFKAQVAAHNSHSLHVAAKLGFEQVGMRRRALYRDDQFHDIILFEKPLY